MPNSEIEQLLQKLRSLLAAEYNRGEQDAIARIMKAAQGVPASSNGGDHVGSPIVKKERAPVGIAKALIERILKDRGQRGATASEIQEAAINDDEKLVSFSGIRFALKRGRDEDKRYRNVGGKWFLRQEKEMAGHGTHDPAAVLPRSNSR